ncbi:MAG TPA: AraC family transcriptional regulator [Gemmatimonadales bacterium]
MSIVSRLCDTSLGRWTHTEWRPDRGHPLEWAVERIWDFEGMAAAPQERMFPNGMVELIVQLDDRYQDVHPAGPVATPAVCVTGVHSRALMIRAPRRPCRVLGVRLYPAAAWALLVHPLSELADVTADLDDLLGRGAAELGDRCHQAGAGRERVRQVLLWLDGRLRRPDGSSRPHPAVQRFTRCIAAAGGARPVRPLGAGSGLSETRLVTLFRQQVGVTPKRYARILRFDRALRLLSLEGASLARVAAAAGYYDQPHMNAEFRDVAGLTPGEFLRAMRFPGSLSLPEPA